MSIHSQEFASYTASGDGDAAVIDGAKALAMTVADLWLRPDVLDAAKQRVRRECSNPLELTAERWSADRAPRPAYSRLAL